MSNSLCNFALSYKNDSSDNIRLVLLNIKSRGYLRADLIGVGVSVTKSA